MNSRSKHCQLAVSFFGDVAAVHRVYAALLDAGLESRQMCVVAPKSTLEQVLFSPAAVIQSDTNSRGTASPELFEMRDQDGRVIFAATSGAVLRALLNAEAAGSLQAPPFRGSQRPQLDVRSQLADGRVALIAQTIEPAQHQAVMRELLATSGTGVTAYQGPFISE